MILRGVILIMCCLVNIGCQNDDTNEIFEEKIFDGEVVLQNQSEVDEFGAMNYTSINGNLIISGNFNSPELTNIDALKSLNTIKGDFEIKFNATLININGLKNMEAVDGNLLIQENISLKNLDGFEKLEAIGGSLIIRNNGLDNIEGLGKLNKIGEDLVIAAEFKIDNLDMFSKVNALKDLYLFGDKISNLNGLKNAKGINSVRLDVKGLTDISALSEMSSSLNVISLSNTLVSDLSVFSNVKNTNYVEFRNNNNIQNFIGLSELESVVGGLVVSGNDNLLNFSGLENLSEIGDEITIEGNLKLSEIGSLTKMTILNKNLYIKFNDKLTSLDGFKNIVSAPGRIEIENNPTLNNFCFLNTLLSNDGENILNISLNAYNPSKEEILAGNCSN